MKTATEDDIRQCFRLLFEREIGPSEMAGHIHFVGQPLSYMLAQYLNSQEFQNRGLIKTSGSDRPSTSKPEDAKLNMRNGSSPPLKETRS